VIGINTSKDRDCICVKLEYWEMISKIIARVAQISLLLWTAEGLTTIGRSGRDFSIKTTTRIASTPNKDTFEHEDHSDEDFSEKDVEDTLVASPLSQHASNEDYDSLYRGSFSRDENWLEQATNEILDPERLPMGSLSEDNVETIIGIMAAWVRRRCVEGALYVEQLLKRVVDDMRAQNPSVHVTARMYTIVSSAQILWKL
jgi:hypothetical protein